MSELPAPAEPSGIDLARQALAEYKARTWAVPTSRSTKPKATPARRKGNKGDPVTLASTLAGLIPDFQEGLNGGSIMDRWATLCPQYDGTVQPVRFDPQRGRLDLRPCSHAFAAQLRLLGGQLAKQINDKLGTQVVRTVRVLPPGNLTPTTPDTPTAKASDASGPPKTRETAHPGYRAALAAHEQHRPDHGPTDPYLLAAIARQDAALRAHRQADPSVVHELEAADEAQARHARSEAARRAALAFKHGRHKTTSTVVPRAFDVA